MKQRIPNAVMRARRNINNEGAYEKVKVTGERVDGVVAEDVALLKMDVEGFEPTAFESAKGVLDTFKCAAPPGVVPVLAAQRSHSYNFLR